MTGTQMNIFEDALNYQDSKLGKAAGFYPYFRPIRSSEGPVVDVGGRRLVMLASSNYLGLSHHPEVVKAAHDAIDQFGVGCSASRFLAGNLELHEQLEAELAEFAGKEDSLVFPSGVLANIGTLGLFGGQPGAVLFLAAENHGSLFDGARLSHGRVALFEDVADLERKLAYRPSWENALVVTDGVFSMTGRVADLRAIADLKKRYGFRLYLDDAHSLGVLGNGGRGTADEQGVTDEVDLYFASFSKSLASVGGFIAGDHTVIEYMRHNVRTMVFSAALPPTSTAAALAALRVMRREPELLERMWDNARFFKQGVEAIGFQTLGTRVPIIPLFFGSEALACWACREAFDLGLFTTPAMYPAVPKGHALIRTNVSAIHTREHLQRALDVLAEVKARLPMPLPAEDASTLPAARETDIAEGLQFLEDLKAALRPPPSN